MCMTFFKVCATPFIGSKMSVISVNGSGWPFSKMISLIRGYHSSTTVLLFAANSAHSGALEVSIVTLNAGSVKAEAGRMQAISVIQRRRNASDIGGRGNLTM